MALNRLNPAVSSVVVVIAVYSGLGRERTLGTQRCLLIFGKSRGGTCPMNASTHLNRKAY